MNEFETLDRCAAYAAAREALEAIHHSSAAWPPRLADLAGQARQAAVDTVMTTVESISYEHDSPGRRRCLRDAIGAALTLAATVDVVRALGLEGDHLDRTQQLAGRSVALLGLFLHASARRYPAERPDPDA